MEPPSLLSAAVVVPPEVAALVEESSVEGAMVVELELAVELEPLPDVVASSPVEPVVSSLVPHARDATPSMSGTSKGRARAGLRRVMSG